MPTFKKKIWTISVGSSTIPCKLEKRFTFRLSASITSFHICALTVNRFTDPNTRRTRRGSIGVYIEIHHTFHTAVRSHTREFFVYEIVYRCFFTLGLHCACTCRTYAAR